MRVDRFLEARFPGLSFSHIQRIVRKGELRVNGKRADSKDRLEEGQSIRIPPLRLDAPKVAGPVGGREQNTADVQGHDLVRGCRRDGAEQAGRALQCRAVQASPQCRRHAGSDARRQGTKAAAGAPAGQGDLRLPGDRQNPLCRDSTDRIVSPSLGAQDLPGAGCGVPKPKQGRISTYLAKDEGEEDTIMRIAAHGDEGASHAVTYYAVVETSAAKLAWVSLKPVTGRTHQLRGQWRISITPSSAIQIFQQGKLAAAGRAAERLEFWRGGS